MEIGTTIIHHELGAGITVGEPYSHVGELSEVVSVKFETIPVDYVSQYGSGIYSSGDYYIVDVLLLDIEEQYFC